MTLNRALIILVTMIIVPFLILSYGSCQWGRVFWDFQQNIWPRNIKLWMDHPAPETFTGRWRTWSPEGREFLTHYVNGVRHGLRVGFTLGGAVEFVSTYSNGIIEEPSYAFYDNGQLREWSSNLAHHDLCGGRQGEVLIGWSRNGDLKNVSYTPGDMSMNNMHDVEGKPRGPLIYSTAKITGRIDRTAEYRFKKQTAREFMDQHGISPEAIALQIASD